MKRVVFQGELGAYSELAAYEFFTEQIRVIPRPTFVEVFDAVENGKCGYGIIPVENSLTGSIHENIDLLLKRKLVICGELKLRIVHCLIGNHGARIKSLHRVFAHPQASLQCRSFLNKLYNVEVLPVYDTAGGAMKVKERGRLDEAAIASAQAAVDYDLRILKKGIESNHYNYTKFVILAKRLLKKGKKSKTSIVYSTKNIPGALFKSLSVFSLRDINLLKIESRPIVGQPWRYMFYLDFEGDFRDEKCKRAIEHLSEIASSIKILGSYRPGEEVEGRVHKRP